MPNICALYWEFSTTGWSGKYIRVGQERQNKERGKGQSWLQGKRLPNCQGAQSLPNYQAAQGYCAEKTVHMGQSSAQ